MAREEREAKNGAVARRRVYYISGFDPEGPRRYHRLYRDEGARQAGIAGYELSVGPLRYEGDAACWTACLTENAGAVTAEVAMLRWDDIARRRMRRSQPSTYLLMLRTLWRYVGSGAFAALCRVRFLSTWVGIYPVAMLILYLVAALAAFSLVAAAGRALGAPVWLFAPAGAAAGWGLMRLTRRWDDATLVYYLMCDFGFTAAHAAGEAPEMEARLDAFARRLRGEWARGDCDEVLIVGHSSGAAYAAAVAARALRLGADGRAGPALSLLTLGQTIPMLSFLPGAAGLRDDLRLLGAAEGAVWIDVSSPADGACYALADPVAVSGAAAAGSAQRQPKVISAKFWGALAPATRKALRGRWFRIHIQYLCAFDDPGDFDYFRITAGARTLAARFAARRPSPQRIARTLIQRRLRGR